MGLSDKLKQFSDKAKESATEHREQITNAVETAGVIADKRTRGRYSDKIAKATAKTGAVVDRLTDQPTDETPPPAGETPPAADQPPPAGETPPADQPPPAS